MSELRWHLTDAETSLGALLASVDRQRPLPQGPFCASRPAKTPPPGPIWRESTGKDPSPRAHLASVDRQQTPPPGPIWRESTGKDPSPRAHLASVDRQQTPPQGGFCVGPVAFGPLTIASRAGSTRKNPYFWPLFARVDRQKSLVGHAAGGGRPGKQPAPGLVSWGSIGDHRPTGRSLGPRPEGC
jgi:hypothetical protein